MPMELQILRYGDRILYETQPKLDKASILIHFNRIRRNIIEWSIGVFPATIGFDCVQLKLKALFTAPMK